MTPFPYFKAAFSSVSILLFLTACSDSKDKTPAPPPPPEVSVITVSPERINIIADLPGRIEATRIAQVRARVPGIVLKRVFKEGSNVKAGDVLFKIDSSQLKATFNSVNASLNKALTNLSQANLKLKRYKALIQTNAVSQQEYEDVLTAQKQALADVETAKANKENANLNLGYATVTAPISGRIGRAEVTEGALVGQGEATPLAVIQQINPIYVTFTQSSNDVLKLQQALESGKLSKANDGKAKVTIVTENGKAYPDSGRLLFSDLAVDAATGSITLRAEFPNSKNTLLPGMYVRAKLEQAVNEQALTIPQQAIYRTVEGASVLVVNQKGEVEGRSIKTEGVQNNKWIVSEGLKAGEIIIVEGVQKVKPGIKVKAIPWTDPQSVPLLDSQSTSISSNSNASASSASATTINASQSKE